MVTLLKYRKWGFKAGKQGDKAEINKEQEKEAIEILRSHVGRTIQVDETFKLK